MACGQVYPPLAAPEATRAAMTNMEVIFEKKEIFYKVK